MVFQSITHARRFAIAALWFAGFMVASSLGQTAAADPSRYNTWQDMCKDHACADFPMDHLTAYFGGQYYYFPMRRLTYPDWQTIDPKKERLELFGGNLEETADSPRRKFSNLGIQFNKCCGELFQWFGMDEAAERNRYSNLMWVYPYLYPFRLGSSKYSLTDSLRYYVYNDETATLPEIDPPQIPQALRTDFSPSFWRLADSYYDKMLVSKKPILAESYVVLRCRPELCDVLTLRPANGDNRPPPLSLHIQLWSPILGKGEGAEDVASYLQDLDKMLRLARRHPKGY